MYAQILACALAGNLIHLAAAQQPFFCWACSCHSMWCGGTCESYPAKSIMDCRNGQFGDKPNCDRWCGKNANTSITSITSNDDKSGAKANQLQSSAETSPSNISLPQATVSHLCSFACDNGVSLFKCLMDGCPDTYGGCKRADSYQVSADGCQTVATYFYKNGGKKADDRVNAHESVAGNALHQAGLRALELRRKSAELGAELGDITADDIASGVKDLEKAGLEKGERTLCQWAVSYTPGSGIFCGFVVKFPVVQWVNTKVLNMPIVGQVTHQIATLAALAPEPVKEAVKNAVHAVATALNNGAKDIITTVKNAASGIVHSVLNFFGWMENSVYAAITGQRGRVPLAKLPDEVVV